MRLLEIIAATSKINPSDIGVTNPVKNADSLLVNVLNTVYIWAGIISVIVIIVGGYLYVTSGGNASNIKRAKDAILGAAIGLIIIIMAFTITQFVLGRF